MAKLISIYWRDIPAQVVGRQGRENFKKELEPRFAKAIDRAVFPVARAPNASLSWKQNLTTNSSKRSSRPAARSRRNKKTRRRSPQRANIHIARSLPGRAGQKSSGKLRQAASQETGIRK